MSLTEEQIRETLKQVIDPELFINIIDLGLVYNVTTAPATEMTLLTSTVTDPAASPPPAAAAEVPATATSHNCSSNAPAATGETHSCSHEHGGQSSSQPKTAVLDLAGAVAKGEATAAHPLTGTCCGEQATSCSESAAEAGPKEDIFIDMTMTSPACPAGPQLIGDTKRVLSRLPGVNKVEVKIVMVPPWTPDKMTEDARDQLGIF